MATKLEPVGKADWLRQALAEIIDPQCWGTDPASLTSNMLFRRRDALRKASEILALVNTLV